MSDYADIWYEEHKKNIKISTAIRMRPEVAYIKQYFGSQKIKDITRLQYQNFLNKLASDKALSTAYNTRNTAKMLFTSAVKYEIINKNPCEYTALPRAAENIIADDDLPLPKFLEKNQLRNFLEKLRESKFYYPFYHLIFVIAYTGMRVGEATALKWTDINWEEKTIRVNKNIYFINVKKREYIFQPTKSKSANRTMSISNKVIDILKEYRKMQLKEKFEHRDCWVNVDDLIFTKSQFSEKRIYGTPIPRASVNYVIHKITAQLEITDIHTHSLRHTHTTLLAEADVSLEAIQERLGHKNDDITHEIYLHITKKTKKEAAQKFDELMDSL